LNILYTVIGFDTKGPIATSPNRKIIGIDYQKDMDLLFLIHS